MRDKDGSHLIAKLPAAADTWNVVVFEAAALELPRRAGVGVPSFRIDRVSGRRLLLTRWFDRDGR